MIWALDIYLLWGILIAEVGSRKVPNASFGGYLSCVIGWGWFTIKRLIQYFS